VAEGPWSERTGLKEGPELSIKKIEIVQKQKRDKKRMARRTGQMTRLMNRGGRGKNE
jgi:hypothetical protein